MTSIEALKELTKFISNAPYSAYKNYVECIEKDFDILEKLKEPVYEEETEDALLHCEYYWDEIFEDLKCDITYYEWDGTYYDKQFGNKTLKMKNWKEKFHSGTASKPSTIKEIQEILELIKNDR